MKHFIALTCEALARSIYAIAATTPHTISIRLFQQGLQQVLEGIFHKNRFLTKLYLDTPACQNNGAGGDLS